MLAKKYIRSGKTPIKMLSASYVDMAMAMATDASVPNIRPDTDNSIDINDLMDNLMSKSVVNHSVVQTVKYDIKQALTHTDNQIIPYSYCGSCGTKFNNLDWPRVCQCCKNETFRNPIPVAVGMLPFFDDNFIGLLLIKRAIKPCIGEFAFPGGFVNWTEPWEETLSREMLEETGIITVPEEYIYNSTYSTPDGTRILIFGMSKKIRTKQDIKHFKPNDEVSELIIGTNQTSLCFSLHQKVYDDFFVNKNNFQFE